MIRGMYEAAASMVSSMTRLMRLSNNLANVTTPGYKQDLSAPHAFKDLVLQRFDANGGNMAPLGSLPSIVVADKPRLDLSQGLLRQTGRPMDLALSGPGFFAVEKDGQELYTRNGTFGVDAQGVLRTDDGGLVLGEQGAITVGAGALNIDQDGSVLVDGVVVDRLKLVNFPDGAELRKKGHSYIENVGGTPEPAGQAGVFQGFLEGANVDVVNAMLELLTSRKTYGSSQHILQLADTALQKAVSELGKV